MYVIIESLKLMKAKWEMCMFQNIDIYTSKLALKVEYKLLNFFKI